MSTRFLALSLAILWTALASAQDESTDPRGPWLGTWRLDPAASPARENAPQYKRVLVTIEAIGEGAAGQLRVAYDMVGTRGGRTHIEWTGPPDGLDYPVQGVDYVLTNAYSLTGPRGYRIVVRVDGQIVATTDASVSPDGEVLKAVTTETGPAGESASTSIYRRE